MLDRSEVLRFTLKLNKQRADKYKEEIRGLLKYQPPSMIEGDSLNVYCVIQLDYYNIVDNLRTIRKLIQDKEIWINVKYEELLHGECLFLAMIDEIKALQKLLKPEKVSWLGSLLTLFRPKVKKSSSLIRSPNDSISERE